MSRKCGKSASALVVGALGFMAGSANAAPYLTVSMLGRIAGSGVPYSSVIAVNPGDVVEYRLNFQLAPEGTTNPYPVSSARTITNWVTGPTTSGLNNLKFDLGLTYTSGSLNVTMLDNLDASGDDGQWDDNANFTNGAAAGNKLTGVFISRPAGNFGGTAFNTSSTGEGAKIEPVMSIATGSFQVTMNGWSWGTVSGSVDTSVTNSLFGGFRWRNATNIASLNYTPTAGQQLNSLNGVAPNARDPIVLFNPLQLNFPEPSTLGLLSVAGLAALARRDRPPEACTIDA
jgi:hypothetical protein